MFARCQYLGENFGDTKKILMTDDPIVVTDHTFKIACGTESAQELDHLVTNPILSKILFTFSDQLVNIHT
jgi:hypothetical protein